MVTVQALALAVLCQVLPPFHGEGAPGAVNHDPDPTLACCCGAINPPGKELSAGLGTVVREPRGSGPSLLLPGPLLGACLSGGPPWLAALGRPRHCGESLTAPLSSQEGQGRAGLACSPWSFPGRWVCL